MIKQIANERPHNLIKYSETVGSDETVESGAAKSIEMTTFGADHQFKWSQSMETSASDSCDSSDNASPYTSMSASGTRISFCQYLSDVFWKLYSMRPKNALISTIAKGMALNQASEMKIF